MYFKLTAFLIVFFLVTGVSAETYTRYGKRVVLKAVPSVRTDGLTHYTTAAGQAIAVGSEIIVKLAGDGNITLLAERTDAVETERLSKNLFLLRYQKGTNVFDILPRVEKMDGVVFAQPNIHSEKERR